MAWFRYTALTANGETVSGELQAADERALIRAIQAQGNLPIETAPLKAAGGGRRGAVPGPAQLGGLARDLALLLRAGQPLEQALALLASGLAAAPLRPRLESVLTRVRAGAGLGDALEGEGGFPPLFIAMVRAGEAAGALEATLAELAQLLERQARLSSLIGSALLYPAVLLTVAVASVLLILLYVVPQFAPLFERAGGELPMTTRAVLASSAWLQDNWTLLMLALLFLLLGVRALGKRPALAVALQRRLLALPVLGPLLADAAVARFARTLGALLQAGAALPASLGFARDVAGPALAAEIDAMRDGVKNGRTLVGSLPLGHRLPTVAVELLRLGEETGRLDEVAGHLADASDARLETALKRLLALLEPASILLIALLVGGIVISILSALVSINALAV